ncbi:type I polyketide synthase [Actinopolyspora erythraea]|uniref:type I polyketide synthase n=1 Tax=Actinopolyspora erythraea TaxID=414996 RepID=UPI0012FDBE82|nr:type I polyketide synthase [Actinopolyspora erythraea]
MCGAPSLERVDVVQPVLFVVMVSLARLWRACGVVPSAVVGHSQGEIAAAVVAGVLSVEDGVRVVALRARALRALAGHGGMISVRAGRSDVDKLLADDSWTGRLEVAAVNGPDAVVVAGNAPAAREFLEYCEAMDIRARAIPVDYASHTAHVESVRDELARALAGIVPRSAEVPFFSTLSGDFLDGTELDAEYWYRNLRHPVEFHSAVRTLTDQGYATFIEASPNPVLGASIQETLDDTESEAAVLTTLERDAGDADRFLAALAEAHTRGVAIDWEAVLGRAELADLPGYPFQGKRFWLLPERTAPRDDLDDWFYRVDWTEVPCPEPASLDGRWLVVVPEGHEDGWATEVRDALAEAGARPEVVRAGDELGDCAGVVSLLALEGDGAVRTLALVQALDAAGTEAPLWMVTFGAVGAGGPVNRPHQAMLWGLGQVASLERGPHWTGLLDLPQTPDPALRGKLTAMLTGQEDQVAVRADAVRARRLSSAHVTATSGYTVPSGTILLTGGNTGIGAEVARWLAERGAEHLALVSRRGPRTEGIDDLTASLTRLGARVSVHSCDVSSRESVRELVHDLAQQGDIVRGVVHAAGLPQRAALNDMDEAAFNDVVAAKVEGAVHLDELCPDAELFLLFSSGAAVWGSARQGAYAAGNAFLDAFAQYRRGRGLPATSVAWGLWAAGGMTGDEEAVSFLRERGLRAMPVPRALAALDRVLAADETTVVVTDVDWSPFVESYTATRHRPLLDRLVTTTSPQRAGETGEPETESLRDRLAGLPRAERRAELVRLVRGNAATVLGHEDPKAAPASTPFKDLGFDSLAAVRMRNMLNAATGLRLPATLVFDHPNALAVADFLEAELDTESSEGRPSALAGLEALEEALPEVPETEREKLAQRLERVLAALRPAARATDTSGTDAHSSGDELNEAGVDELLEALGQELDDE